MLNEPNNDFYMKRELGLLIEERCLWLIYSGTSLHNDMYLLGLLTPLGKLAIVPAELSWL